MKLNYIIGSNEEAANTIIAFAMTSGEETEFIKQIPQKRKSAILGLIKTKSEFVYNLVKKDF